MVPEVRKETVLIIYESYRKSRSNKTDPTHLESMDPVAGIYPYPSIRRVGRQYNLFSTMLQF